MNTKNNREHKYRAWDNKGERMLGVRRLNFVVSSEGLGKSEFWVINEPSVILEVSLDNVELMRYTGLKDKNGKEIWEGDVLKWTPWRISSGHKATKISEVIWSVGAWRLSGNEAWAMAIYTNIEVIGNIYENPELVKVV